MSNALAYKDIDSISNIFSEHGYSIKGKAGKKVNGHPLVHLLGIKHEKKLWALGKKPLVGIMYITLRPPEYDSISDMTVEVFDRKHNSQLEDITGEAKTKYKIRSSIKAAPELKSEDRKKVSNICYRKCFDQVIRSKGY